MKNTEDPQSLSRNSPKDYQGNQVTYEDVLNLLGINELPFLDTQELRKFAIEGMKDILERHDSEWVAEHRVRLIEELELISGM